MAVSIDNAKSDQVRVRFSLFNGDYIDPQSTFYDAVNCTDLYADEIELERTGIWATSYFNSTFNYFKRHWICPNATNIDLKSEKFRVEVLQCSRATNASYAANHTCSDEEFDDYLSVNFLLVSTVLQADPYYAQGSLMLNSEMDTYPLPKGQSSITYPTIKLN